MCVQQQQKLAYVRLGSRGLKNVGLWVATGEGGAGLFHLEQIFSRGDEREGRLNIRAINLDLEGDFIFPITSHTTLLLMLITTPLLVLTVK